MNRRTERKGLIKPNTEQTKAIDMQDWTST